MKPVKEVFQEVMPKLDVEKDKHKLRPTDLIYMKRVQEQCFQRAQRVKIWRKKNNITATCLFAVVVGVYTYTIYAVKQEKFLDDLNEPEKIIESPAQSKN